MTTHTVACPQCKTALRSDRPLTGSDMVRCPQCGSHFFAAPPPNAAVVAPQPPPASGFSLAFLFLLVPAALLAAVLGVGAVVGAYFLVRPHPPSPPVANADPDRDHDREAELAKKQRDLEAKEKELDEQKRRQEYERLMAAGEKRLAEKKYADAITAFQDALKLFPNDAKALDGLVAAKAGQRTAAAPPADTKPAEDADKNKAFDKVMAEGRKAMADKKYALACTLFESAAKLKPGDDAAVNALLEAKKELEKDAVAKQQLADYQKAMDAGTAALKAGRYADAIREFLAAQRLVPNDAAALKGEQEAKKQLAQQDADKKKQDFNRQMDKANAALKDKKYDDAIDAIKAALQILPDDPGARQLLADATKAQANAKTAYDRLMADADAARLALRYDDARLLYMQALQIMPLDPRAQQAQQDMERLLASVVERERVVGYRRAMTAAARAMAAKRYDDALVAYTEALRLVPTDLEAARGAEAAKQFVAQFEGFMTVGDTAMTKKFYGDAVNAYRDALKVIPDQPRAVAGLRAAHYARGMNSGEKAMGQAKYADAINFFKEALEANPGDPAAKEKLHNAHYRRGIEDGTALFTAKKYADAIPLFEEALKAKPDDFTAKDLIRQSKYFKAMADGDAAIRAGKFDDAISFYQEALKEKPNDGKATKALEDARKKKK
jgi:tetratricopeptide (TPR) repeat protein